MASLEHNIRFGLDQFISIEITYDRRLQDSRVRYECVLDLNRRDPQPSYLQHII